MITFIDKYNTSIATLNNHNEPTDFSILYNCGEDRLNYVVNDYLTGPNFNLTRIDQQENN